MVFVDTSPELTVAVDRTFATAFIDNGVRHRLFGRRLLPFSLWHRFLLLAINSPFLNGEPVTLFDIREAIAICSVRYPRSKIRRPWIIPILCFLWYANPRKRWTEFLIRSKDQLLDYFGDYISRPEYTIKDPDPYAPPPAPIGEIPEGFVVLADVISFLCCTKEEAWNMPVGQAYWYQMANVRDKGDQVDFMDEGERQFQEEMKIHKEIEQQKKAAQKLEQQRKVG